MPQAQALEEGQPRVEVRLTLGLTPEELLAGAWEAQGLWEESCGPELVPVELVRWYVMSAVVMVGGPQGPGLRDAELTAYREGARPEGRVFHQAARELVYRAFGVWPRPALAVQR
ncbi:hypothetical protein AB0M05_47290 [Streptomyces violaceusniger]|uniref:hypothetical protein n=1 Tax=Streptomyces violaceusniger TaxID=68280 RepID=UPI003421804A